MVSFTFSFLFFFSVHFHLISISIPFLLLFLLLFPFLFSLLFCPLNLCAYFVAFFWVFCVPLQLGPLPDGFDDTYDVAGCSNPAHCGVFTRVPASCTSGYWCPGGRYANGNTDPTLCDSAPVYQEGGPGGPVLYRAYFGDGDTQWTVGPSVALNDCRPNGYLVSDSNPGRPGGAPTAPGYSAGHGWCDGDNNYARGTITVTAGDGSAIGGGGGGH